MINVMTSVPYCQFFHFFDLSYCLAVPPHMVFISRSSLDKRDAACSTVTLNIDMHDANRIVTCITVSLDIILKFWLIDPCLRGTK